MIKLKRNSGRMGLRPKSETWEWYTTNVSGILNIHVHNNTKSGDWAFETAIRNTVCLSGFDTKEEAFRAAKSNVKEILDIALRTLE